MRPDGYDEKFSDRFARRVARRYRRRGLSRSSRAIVSFLTERGIEGVTVLEIGGGVGEIQVELLLLGGAVVAHVREGDGPKKFAPAVICGVLVAAYLVALPAATS